MSTVHLRLLCLLLTVAVATTAERPPNIILVMPDDTGYGDWSCNGSPIMKTPHVDALAKQSIRFTEFCVSPTCAPTRAALLTGRHEFRNGVTHTIYERERMALESITLPQVLARAGYVSGTFGKWHLGDEMAYRPNSRGFTEMFIHGAGGIGQTYAGSCGDAPGNKYQNPAILHNDKFVKTEGYCTDLFFDQAITWMDQQRKTDKPFYCQIWTNVAHGPLQVSKELESHWQGKAPNANVAKFYGMIENFDENVGKLTAKLDEWGMTEDTIFIFLFSDNGGTQGVKVFNDGMRGAKGSQYRGGTRVGSLWSWPKRWQGGVDCKALTAHIDVLPTLTAIAGVPLDEQLTAQVEGKSLLPLLQDPNAEWPERTLIAHRGRWPFGKANAAKYDSCSIRTADFSLVDNKHLYDLRADPGEKDDVADKHPDVVKKLRAEYDAWWEKTLPLMVNEEAYKTAPNINPFKEQYWAQFGGEPTPELLKKMSPKGGKFIK